MPEPKPPVPAQFTIIGQILFYDMLLMNLLGWLTLMALPSLWIGMKLIFLCLDPPPHFLNHYQNFCLVGKIFGQPVSATVVQEKCLANWQGLQGTVTIERFGNLWFRIEFIQEEDLIYVLDNRPWFVKGRIFHLRKWTPSFSATFAKIDKLIVWVRLPFLPLHLWDPDTLQRIVQVIGRFIRVDEATAMGDHCIFARVCVEIDLRFPLKRVIVLHPENQDDEVARIRVSYEALFEICFNCGNFSHRFEVCPMRQADRHFILVDRLENEPAVFPPEMQQLEEVQNLISNDSLVIFPQPSYAYQAGNQFGEGNREEQDQSDQDTRTWSVVARQRGRGRGRNMYTRGGGRAIVGAKGVWTTAVAEPPGNPLPTRAPRNPSRIRIVNRQVNEDNIIVIPEDNSNDLVWPSSPLLSLSPLFSTDCLRQEFNPDNSNDFMLALPSTTFNLLDDSNSWDHLIKSMINNYHVPNQENLQDANEQGNLMVTGENDPTDDLPEDDLPEDNVLVVEGEHPMNFYEALDFQGIRKRSRNQIDSDDEMNNGSHSVNGPII
ncbi:hypothetical protein M0R45_036326 [Rubus argutus]|uniref:DUF4283 domain-containing protein n=1 Tax=Rubus argutus TaxID=59490 RepID=A0AAW1VYK0_RUBAR